MRDASQLIDIEPSHRAIIIGKTGSGKTELAKALVTQYPYLICLDRKKDFRLPNARYPRTPKELYDTKFRTYEPIIYQPSVEFWDRDSWNEVFTWIYQKQNLTLYVDEAYSVIQRGVPPQMFVAIIVQGRSLNIRTITCSQRPVWIPAELLSESEHYICFHVKKPEDREVMAGYMGAGVLAPLTNKHSFHYYSDDSDQIRECILKLPEDING